MKLPLLLLPSLLVACGGPSPLTDAPVHGDPDAPNVPLDTPAGTKTGLVTISQGTNNGTPSSNVSAIFATGDVFGTLLGTDGPCTVTLNPVQRGISAGPISVTGTTSAFTLTPNGTAPDVNYTTAPTAPTVLFTAGATLSITAAGGPDIPAFSTTLTAPTTIAGFTPPASLSRAGYTATWTAGAGQQMWIIMIAIKQATDPAFVVCRVPDTGSFAIPASTFALIPAGYTSAGIGVGRTASKDVATAAGHVTVAAFSNVTSALVTLNP